MTQDVAKILDGDVLAAELRQGLAARAAGLRVRGTTPRLVTVLVGDDPVSLAYLGRKHADCAETGIESEAVRLPADTTDAGLAAVIDRLNADAGVHGFLVQLPLPGHLDAGAALERIDPAKDIDGLHPLNLGRLLAGTPAILPCTPAGVLELLRAGGVPLAGRRVAVIGRGALVGRPLAMLLSMRGIDADVCILHSRSPDIAAVTRTAEILVSAAGRPGLVTADMVRPGAAVVGVGIGRDAAGETVSDIAADVASVAGRVTPMHGSVGPLTRAMLLRNLLDCAAAAALSRA